MQINVVRRPYLLSDGITFGIDNMSMQKLHQRLLSESSSLCQRINEIDFDMSVNAGIEMVVSFTKKVTEHSVKILQL